MNEHIDSGCSDLGISQSIKSSKLGSAPTTLATKPKAMRQQCSWIKSIRYKCKHQQSKPVINGSWKTPSPESRLGSLRSSGTAKVPKIEPSEIANTSPNKTNEGESSNNQHAGPLKQTTKHKPTGFFNITDPALGRLVTTFIAGRLDWARIAGGTRRSSSAVCKAQSMPIVHSVGSLRCWQNDFSTDRCARVWGGSTPEGAGVRFVELSATIHGTNDCKRIFEEARRDKMLTGRRTFCSWMKFIDSTKVNKTYFFRMLKGDVILIGATTENLF